MRTRRELNKVVHEKNYFRRSICILIVMIVQASSAQSNKRKSNQAAPRLPLELILSPDHITVVPRGTLGLSVNWINRSDDKQPCASVMSSSGLFEMYIYDVRTIDGRPVPRTPGKEKEKAEPYPGGEACFVFPGASFDQGLPGLMQAFEMNQPGKYTVQVSVPDPNRHRMLLGISNVVTVTAKAKE